MSPYSRIINRKHPSQAVDCPIATPELYLVGNHINGSQSQNWDIVSVGGDSITMWSAFAKNYVFPPIESEGALLTTAIAQYRWHQLSDTVGGWYRIATTDKRYVWRLKSGDNYAPIELVDFSYEGEDAQWAYEPSQ